MKSLLEHAQAITDRYKEVDYGMVAMYYLPRGAPDNVVRLLEVNQLTVEFSELMALCFSIEDGGSKLQYLVDVTPKQMEAVRAGELALPEDWSLEGMITLYESTPAQLTDNFLKQQHKELLVWMNTCLQPQLQRLLTRAQAQLPDTRIHFQHGKLIITHPLERQAAARTLMTPDTPDNIILWEGARIPELMEIYQVLNKLKAFQFSVEIYPQQALEGTGPWEGHQVTLQEAQV